MVPVVSLFVERVPGVNSCLFVAVKPLTCIAHEGIKRVPTMFNIKLHHGGNFMKLPNTKYVKGEVRYIDLVDIDEFSVHELDAMMLELGYSVPPVIYYHFRIPHEDLDFGLRALGNDNNVLNLAQYIGDNKVIEVYTEHGQTNLLTYFMSPKGKQKNKPIIGCLEYIRQYLMKRICNVMKVMDKAKGPLTPTVTTILDVNKSHASHYIARWNGGEKYQVTGAWQDQHVVDVRNNTCTCRKWELIGIPCKHAIATLYEMTKNSEDVGDIYRWVNKVYWLDTWKNAYSYKVEPIKGRIMWPKSLCPTKLIPPIHHKQPGRPTKKRKKSEDEKLSQSQRGSQSQSGTHGVSQEEGCKVGPDGVQKLTKKYVSVTCAKCKNKGHNSRTCKGQGGGNVICYFWKCFDVKKLMTYGYFGFH
uniref:SWIM-type domain-containing protein n=1 Tax=Lactuca sativa TaxID=4236 RepID=A0A9R1W2I6_LACSA|nr:hypothetical protein LSAT_V11C300120200 [Lactuca sativa]